MCSINWTKSRGHILFCKILSKRSPWALKDEEPCLFYCKDTPNSLGGMRLFYFLQYLTIRLFLPYYMIVFYKLGLLYDFKGRQFCTIEGRMTERVVVGYLPS